MQKWEYNVAAFSLEKDKWKVSVSGRDYPLQDTLSIFNNLGSQGWELVSSIPFISSESPFGTTQVFTETNSVLLYFKRPMP